MVTDIHPFTVQTGEDLSTFSPKYLFTTCLVMLYENTMNVFKFVSFSVFQYKLLWGPTGIIEQHFSSSLRMKMMQRKILLSVYLTVLAGIIVNTSAEQVPAISFSLTGRAACVGEDVTLTCEALIGAGRSTWVIGSDNNTIKFSLEDRTVYLGATMRQFSASLTNYTRDEQYIPFPWKLDIKTSYNN